VVAAFQGGLAITVSDTMASAEYMQQIGQVSTLQTAVKKLGAADPASAASAVEFILEGLHLSRKLNKDVQAGRTRYRGSAGSAATLMSRDEGYAQVRLPSGEIRRVHEDCYATVGQVGNLQHENVILGKAGRSRHRGIRPINRGVSRNPVDHPNGGGAGKSKSGGGWQQLTSPWGLQAKGYRTRHKRKLSSRFIVVRRDGRPMKQK